MPSDMPCQRRGVPRSSRPRWSVPAAAAVVALVVVPGSAAADEQLPEERSCPVVAAAQGVQVMLSASDNIFLEKPAGLSLPAAQSCVDYGVRDSWGFAGAPYPGKNMTAMPGLLRSETGLPIPDYPAYAASRYPTVEESESAENGYALSARSQETSSTSTARTGVGDDTTSAGSSRVSATSIVDPATKTSEASARSDAQPVTINDVLELGRVRSEATATLGEDGTVRRDSRLQVGRTSVAGQEIEITPDGVKAVDQDLDLPATDPVDALDAAGVSVRYLAETKTKRGVLSAGIEVLARQQDPETGTVYTVHYTFGRAFAAVAEVAGGPDDSALDLGAPPGEAGGGGVTDGGSGGGSDVGGGLAGGPAGEAGAPDTAAEMTDVPEAAGAPELAEAPAVDAAPQRARQAAFPADMGLAGAYLVIMFSALAMFAGGTLLRLLGVKRWAS